MSHALGERSIPATPSDVGLGATVVLVLIACWGNLATAETRTDLAVAKRLGNRFCIILNNVDRVQYSLQE